VRGGEEREDQFSVVSHCVGTETEKKRRTCPAKIERFDLNAVLLLESAKRGEGGEGEAEFLGALDEKREGTVVN